MILTAGHECCNTERAFNSFSRAYFLVLENHDSHINMLPESMPQDPFITTTEESVFQKKYKNEKR